MVRNCMVAVMLCGGLVTLSGCGNYTVTFQVADVINAWSDDRSAEMLDVDIVCVTPADAKRHPELTNGTLRADEWFKKRDMGDTDMDPTQIYALRRGQPGDKRDTLMGSPLLSGRDRKPGEPDRMVKFKHPVPGSSESAILIIGRFIDKDGVAKSEPVMIKPPPGWGDPKDLIISVGRTSMSWVNRGKK